MVQFYFQDIFYGFNTEFGHTVGGNLTTPWFHPEVRLLTCFLPLFLLCFLWVFQFALMSQKHVGRSVGDSK